MKITRLGLIFLVSMLIGANAQAGSTSAAPRCGSGVATIVGTSRDDELVGTPRSDVIVGRGGEDSIEGKGGDDVICGGAGFDFVSGGRGSDVLRGGGGDDGLLGGAGDDRAFGDRGVDFLTGGEGDDHLVAGPNPAPALEDLMGGPGDDFLDGGPGLDRVQYFDAPQGVEVDLLAGSATGDGVDELTDIEGVMGSNFDDVLVGTDAGNGLIGQAGDDTLRGLGSGTLESDSDFLWGGDGADTLEGGDGFDFASFEDGCVPVTVDLPAGVATGAQQDAIDSIEGAFGSECEDVFVGDAQDNAFLGGGGDDILVGGSGTDTAVYLFSFGPVVANLEAGAARGPGVGVDGLQGMENLWGSSFGDLLVGDQFGNEIRGFFGRDSLVGGAGDDFLEGGDQADRADGQAGVDTCLAEFTLGCEVEQASASPLVAVRLLEVWRQGEPRRR